MDTVFNYYSDVIYSLCDYYNNNISDDLEYFDYDDYDNQIEQCYEEIELHKDIEALIEERSWAMSFRYMAIRRIAIEAHNKKVSYTLIFKFFKEYEIQPNERIWFWMEYYNYNNYK